MPRARRIGRRTLGSTVAAVAVLLLAGSGLIAPTGGSAPAASGAVPAAPTPHISHVVQIVLENEVISEVWAHGTYEKYLASVYGNATDFYAACHPSAPNYLAMVAAVTNQCGSDNWNNDSDNSIGDLLVAAHDSYAGFAEDLPSNACSSPGSATSGLFATRHVPFLYFSHVLANQSFCASHILPASTFRGDVANGTLPTYSFFTPNLCDDGHNGCGGNTTMAQETKQADAWLRGFLSPILNHTGMYNTSAEIALVAHTLFIVTWDEGLGSNAGYAISGVTSGENYKWCQTNGATGDAVCGGPIYAVFVSPYSVGRSYSKPATDYNLVRTVEWLFHLPHLHNPGGMDARATIPPMTSMFNFTSNPK